MNKEQYYLYIAKDSSRDYKVGISRNVQDRTTVKLNLTPIASFGPFSKDQALNLENEVLDTLSGYAKFDAKKGSGWTEYFIGSMDLKIIIGCVFSLIECLDLDNENVSIEILDHQFDETIRIASKTRYDCAIQARCFLSDEMIKKRRYFNMNGPKRKQDIANARARARASGAFDLVRDREGQIIPASPLKKRRST